MPVRIECFADFTHKFPALGTYRLFPQKFLLLIIIHACAVYDDRRLVGGTPVIISFQAGDHPAGGKCEIAAVVGEFFDCLIVPFWKFSEFIVQRAVYIRNNKPVFKGIGHNAPSFSDL